MRPGDKIMNVIWTAAHQILYLLASQIFISLIKFVCFIDVQIQAIVHIQPKFNRYYISHGRQMNVEKLRFMYTHRRSETPCKIYEGVQKFMTS